MACNLFIIYNSLVNDALVNRTHIYSYFNMKDHLCVIKLISTIYFGTRLLQYLPEGEFLSINILLDLLYNIGSTVLYPVRQRCGHLPTTVDSRRLQH